MIAPKLCPQCRGDIYFGPHGDNLCLQCGHELRASERHALLAARPDVVRLVARATLHATKEDGRARRTA